MELKKWYNSYIPEIETKAFSQFAGHVWGLAESIAAKKRFSAEIDWNSPSAYFDSSSNTIALPGWYFKADAIIELGSSDPDLSFSAISLINGSGMHEALHLQYSEYDFAAEIRSLARLKNISESNAQTIINIVEDLYIEGLSSGGIAKAWISAKNSLLFNQSALDKVIKAYQDKLTFASITDLMVCLKNTGLRTEIAKVLDPELFKLLTTITATKTQSQAFAKRRMTWIDVAQRIIELIGADSTSEPMGKGMSHSIDKAGATEGPIDPEIIEKIKAIIDELDEDEKTEIANGFQAGTSVSGEVRKVESGGKINPVYETSVKEYKESIQPMPAISLSNRFAMMLKRMRSVAENKGIAKKSGSNINPLQLSRVATDNKVFMSKSLLNEQQNDNIELVLLVDASGSMEYFQVRLGENRYSLLNIALAVAEKIYKALLFTDVTTQLFAHTSAIRNFKTYPFLVEVCGNRDKKFSMNIRKALNINASENYDGIIIEHVVKTKFHGRGRKVLIVLSDGRPSAPGYTNAIAHTTSVVANAHKNGVEVYSVSLVKHVVETNDKIYGSEFNVDGTEDLDNAMVTLVSKLIQKRR